MYKYVLLSLMCIKAMYVSAKKNKVAVYLQMNILKINNIAVIQSLHFL